VAVFRTAAGLTPERAALTDGSQSSVIFVPDDL
jgi:hypothetical protein